MTPLPSPQEFCDSIHQNIHSSNLNYVIHQTPYSSYITLRKSFNRNLYRENLDSNASSATLQEGLEKKTKDAEAQLNSWQTEIYNLRCKLSEKKVALEEKEKTSEISLLPCIVSNKGVK